ncbi:MAG: fatty acid desaturase [Chloroflexi bacterium]|nr:fatty acid desaturase [Chloroflexota bacterium]MCC6891388.1 fatty acid desaturase [Anaerolineae bacterium]
MSKEASKQRIKWYRSPIAAEELAQLNRRSDWKGLLQSVGYLGLLVLTGGLAWYAVGRIHPLGVLALLFLHGTFYAFLVNGFHELCHQTVFQTRYLNTVFLYIFSFLGWFNPVFFWASHQEHHKYTLHPPDDLEVVLPVKLTLKSYLAFAFINPQGLYNRLVSVIRLSRGKVDGEWANHLFPPSEPEKRRALFTWARILLVGHGLIVLISLALGLWMLPVVLTLAPFYGAGFQYLLNEAQHIGLSDNVSDYRLNTRTILVNPFLRFLYWNMNYHIEHHMFAAVPCYNLPKLHRLIEQDLPHSPNGLVETWSIIIPIIRKQQADKDYQFVPELP